MKRTILLFALVMTGSLAFAQHREGNKEKNIRLERRAQDPEARIAERLELTEDQVIKMEQLRLSHLKATSATKSQLKVKQAELDAAMSAEQPDRKQTDRLVEEINRLQGTLFAERINHRMEVRAMLDEKQKLLFDQKRERMSEGRGRGKRG